MNIFVDILFLGSLVYLVIGVVVLSKDPKAVLNRSFFALNLCLFIWSFFMAVMTMSPNKSSCIFWELIASLGYCTFPSLSLHFFLIYSKKNELLKKRWFYLVLYLPAAIFLFQAFNHNLFTSDYFYNQYGWIAIANEKSIWFWMFLLCIAASGIINILLCYSILKNSITVKDHKSAKTMFISAIISFTLGMGYVFFTRVWIAVAIPDMTIITLLFWLLGILYAIVKYQLMVLTPTLAADTILQTITDSVILVSPKGLITYSNPETLSLLGYENTDLLEKPFEILFPEDIKSEMEGIDKALVDSSIHNQETFFISKENVRIPVLFSAAICTDQSGDYIGFVASSRDITHYKQREEEIKYLSYHDQLTGLYNRRFYEEELMRLDTKRNLPLAIIMGDVNGLKVVNDSIGHAYGDELLQKVAKALMNGCRADDIVARFGGDEFVVLLPKTDRIQAEQIIERINSLLKKEKVAHLSISVSFGCEVKQDEHEMLRNVLKASENLMYKSKSLERANKDLKIIDLIMNALYEKNHGEMLHSKRVGELCEATALKMGFEKETVYRIKMAGLLHDIGKIGIDDRSLNKAEQLDADEWIAMKKHPETGQRIVSAISELSEVGDYISEHQEKWDGSGYPKGLKGEQILVAARIISIADSYDAMTSHRNYQKEFSPDEAANEIKRCSGTQFDPTIARIFVEKVLGNKWD